MRYGSVGWNVSRLLRIFVKMLLVIIVVATAGLSGGYLWLATSLPATSGRIVLDDLRTPVRVTRDRLGLVTIEAQSDRDAAMALGYVHAQDRLFQMDLMRHTGAGRLAEWFGEAALGSDRLMRTLGLSRAVEEQFGNLSEPVRQALEAYAAGVNAYLAGHRGAWPPEYYALRTEPEAWRPTESLLWGKLIDLTLTGNFRGELLRAQLLQKISREQLDVLYRPYPEDGPVASREIRASVPDLPYAAVHGQLWANTGPARASNNWVVAGSRSSTGKPILANDPHLAFSAPGPWYLARIVTPEVRITGATAPGTPFVIIGHNDHVAWGLTTTRGDVADLYVETLDAESDDRYRTPDGALPFEIRQEVIQVRDQAPRHITVHLKPSRRRPAPGFAGAWPVDPRASVRAGRWVARPACREGS